MWRVFLLVAVIALGWAGWRYMAIPAESRGVVAFNALEAASESEAEDAPLTRGSAGDPLLPESSGRLSGAPIGIEGGARRAGPDLSGAFEDVPLAYNRPQSAPLNRQQSVSLIIDPTAAADALAILESYPGEVVQREADLTAIVSANLSGPGFSIERMRPERQFLSTEGPSQWEWAVTPTMDGVQRLTLEVFAYPGGGDVASPVRAYQDDIMVTVGATQRALAFVQTAEPTVGFVTALVSFTLALFGFVRRR